MVESCYKRHKTTLNPIIDWEDRDVWDFIKSNGIPYCSLYNEGFHRLGCIGCPMSGRSGRERDFIRYPKFKKAYLMAFDKMLELRRERHREDPSKPVWRQAGYEGESTAINVFNWWIEDKNLIGQYNLFELDEDDEEI